MSIFVLLSLHVVLVNVLVPKYCELLLDRRLLLLGYVKLVQSGMNIFHDAVEIKRKADVKIRAPDEFSDRLFIKLLVIVIDKDSLIVQLLSRSEVVMRSSII